MDNDSVQRKDSYVKILSAFAEGKAQILVGHANDSQGT